MKNLIPWKWHWGGRKNTPGDLEAVGSLWGNAWDLSFPSLWGEGSSSLPSVDVSESKKEYSVRAELPGLSEKEIGVTWQDGVLTITGEKKEEKEKNGKNRYYRECRYGSFHRNIFIGDNAEWKKARAKYKKGVLSITLPKKEAAEKKSIIIN